MLKPKDVYVICMLTHLDVDDRWTYDQLARMLRISTSVAHEAIVRGNKVGLVDGRKPVLPAIFDFLERGVFYVCFQERGTWTRGIGTGGSRFPADRWSAQDDECLVWPHPRGKNFGHAFKPLHPSVLRTVHFYPAFHDLLALVDILRDPASTDAARRTALRRLQRPYTG